MRKNCFLIPAAAAALTAAWGQDLSGMAAGVLQQTDDARQAITRRDRNAAADHVTQATILAGEIEKRAPVGTNPILVPVYREVDSTSVYRPVKRGKSQVLSANRLERDTSVREVEGTTTVGRLNVSAAASSLRTASAALERNDWAAADTALAAVRNGIVRNTTQDRMPLLMARDNLRLAQDRVWNDRFSAAAAPLRAAAEALADFEKLAPGPHVRDVEYMRQQIDSYARNIEKRHADAAKEIGYWLWQVNRWNQEFTK